MMELLYSLADMRNLLTLVIGFLTFLTVITVSAPYFRSRQMNQRVDLVVAEREKLRAQQRARLEAEQQRARLREKPRGLVSQIVDGLNLRRVFDVDATRKRLRMAGLRTEKHLVTFLAARVIAPLFLGVLSYVYASTVFAEQVPASLRLPVAIGGMALGYLLPSIILTNMIQRRQDSIRLIWSDALDLLLICVESGQSIEQAMNRVALEVAGQSKALAEELQLTTAELSYLGDRRKAFENLAQRTGLATVKAVATSLIQAEKYGTPLGQALRVLAQENRDERMSLAEKKAAALPPKLTVPMILFFLPVIFVVLLGPSLILVFKAQ